MKSDRNANLLQSKSILDIGSQSIICLHGRRDTGGVTIQGYSRVQSLGVSSGTIVNINQVKDQIAMAVDQTQLMSASRIHEVMVNLSFGRPASKWITESYDFKGEKITSERLTQASQAVKKFYSRGGYFVQTIPLEYDLDGNRVLDPVGMIGSHLQIAYHLILVNDAARQTVKQAINECGLNVHSYKPTALAAAWGVLGDEEMMEGITVIDFGSETTTLGIIDKGVLVHTVQLRQGHSLITRALARAFQTPLDYAEEIKKHYGSAVVDGSVTEGEDPTIDLPVIDDSYPARSTSLKQSVLHQVVNLVLEPLVNELRQQVNRPELSRYRNHRLVLTGGGSMISGIATLVSEKFEQPAIIKNRTNLFRAHPDCNRPDYAVAVGLLVQFTRTKQESPFNKVIQKYTKRAVEFFSVPNNGQTPQPQPITNP